MMALKHKKILAIDDADSIRSFLKISMEARGADFFEADNAERGLALCHEVHPDLVVLDLGLPDRDGLDILPLIKTMDGRSPHVIILSVRKDHDVKQRASELGADGYITKPFMMEELMDTIVSYVNRPHP